jgi:hypothetical protein
MEKTINPKHVHEIIPDCIFAIKKQMEEIAGSWNGRDDQFICNGELFPEEAAHAAQDAMDMCDELETVCEQVMGYGREPIGLEQ